MSKSGHLLIGDWQKQLSEGRTLSIKNIDFLKWAMDHEQQRFLTEVKGID